MQVYVPGKSHLGKGETLEELEFDPKAYRFFHRFTSDHPCLTLDALRLLPAPATAAPLAFTIVAGTQAANVRHNAITLARLSNLHPRPEDKERKDDDEDDDDSSSSEDEEDEEEDEEGEEGAAEGTSKKPRLRFADITHHGGINRVRAAGLGSAAVVAAVWNEAGKVQVWNLAGALAALDRAKSSTLKEKPLFTFPGHQARPPFPSLDLIIEEERTPGGGLRVGLEPCEDGSAGVWGQPGPHLRVGDGGRGLLVHQPTPPCRPHQVRRGSPVVPHRREREQLGFV